MKFIPGSVLLFFLVITSCGFGAQRPNIIYILTDDLGYGDLGCYGQKQLTTPHLDRMAAEGMKFTRHYAGSTVCAPSRCVLMTGLHTGHCAVRANGPGLIPDNALTVPKLLKDAGYNTACIGKYGLGLPLPADDPQKKGFDYFFGYVDTAHAHNAYTTFLTRNGERVNLQNRLIPGMGDKKEGMGVAALDGRPDFAPEILGKDVLNFLDMQTKAERPFFLYYALNLPHANNEAGKNAPLRHGMETPSYGEYADRDWPDAEKGFASMMRFVDNEVGAILAKLKALGLDKNTLVMFASDNGPHHEGLHKDEFFNSNGPLKGTKRDLTDGGIRVPFIAWWPGTIEAGKVSDRVSAFQDLLPTVAELSGAKVEGECDGISLAPTLTGKAQQPSHSYLFWTFEEQGGKQAVLRWPWKLIHLNSLPGSLQKTKAGKVVEKELKVELYDLEKDPGEARNVASENVRLVTELEALMREAWRSPNGK